jgi:hypothetical protein
MGLRGAGRSGRTSHSLRYGRAPGRRVPERRRAENRFGDGARRGAESLALGSCGRVSRVAKIRGRPERGRPRTHPCRRRHVHAAHRCEHGSARESRVVDETRLREQRRQVRGSSACCATLPGRVVDGSGAAQIPGAKLGRGRAARDSEREDRGQRAGGHVARVRHGAGTRRCDRLRPRGHDQHPRACAHGRAIRAGPRADWRLASVQRKGRNAGVDRGQTAGVWRPAPARRPLHRGGDAGVETLYRFRHDLALDRTHAVVAAVGASFELDRGIAPGLIAK